MRTITTVDAKIRVEQSTDERRVSIAVLSPGELAVATLTVNEARELVDAINTLIEGRSDGGAA